MSVEILMQAKEKSGRDAQSQKNIFEKLKNEHEKNCNAFTQVKARRRECETRKPITILWLCVWNLVGEREMLKGTNQGISPYAVLFFPFYTFSPGPPLQFWSATAEEEFTALQICGCFL